MSSWTGIIPCSSVEWSEGVTFGLKMIFKDHVHCFFAEPTYSPCILVGLMMGLHDKISVQELGIDNNRVLSGRHWKVLISGVYTIEDDELYALLTSLMDLEDIRLEPSALAGVFGPAILLKELRD